MFAAARGSRAAAASVGAELRRQRDADAIDGAADQPRWHPQCYGPLARLAGHVLHPHLHRGAGLHHVRPLVPRILHGGLELVRGGNRGVVHKSQGHTCTLTTPRLCGRSCRFHDKTSRRIRCCAPNASSKPSCKPPLFLLISLDHIFSTSRKQVRLHRGVGVAGGAGPAQHARRRHPLHARLPHRPHLPPHRGHPRAHARAYARARKLTSARAQSRPHARSHARALRNLASAHFARESPVSAGRYPQACMPSALRERPCAASV